jgi:Salmonella virulence plasmid 65kDa B protein
MKNIIKQSRYWLLCSLLFFGYQTKTMAQSTITSLDTTKKIIVSSQLLNSQTDDDFANQLARIKSVIPPSPNAASLGKYADFPVNLYNGIPSISIPVYELKGRSISVPISLSYHASGIKVGEVASWVGLGWSLNAGGVITRSVKGLPDESPTIGFFDTRTHYTKPDEINFDPSNPNTWKVDIRESAKGTIDFEPDIYMFNAMGRSFKLLFKADGSIQTIPYSDIKVSVNLKINTMNQTWTVLLEDGTKLVFGGSKYVEISDGADLDVTPFVSSWYLQSMTSSIGEVITFSYNTNTIKNDDGISESDYIRYLEDCNGNGMLKITDSPLIKTKDKHRYISMLQLSNISSENGKVDFITEQTERLDLASGYALKTIVVTPNGTIQPVAQYQLNYSYSDAIYGDEFNPTNDNTFRKRLKLISFQSTYGNSSIVGQQWSFTYNAQNLPSRRSYAHDYWSYFNGATNNKTLLPPAYYPPPLPYQSASNIADFGFFPDKHIIANREPNETFMQAEMLNQIKFPTGGYTKFNYEPNNYSVNEEQFQSANKTLSISTNSLVATSTITTTKRQYIKVTFSGIFSMAYLNADGRNILGTISITDANNNTLRSFSIQKGNSLIVGRTFITTFYINLVMKGDFNITLQGYDGSPIGTDDLSMTATIEYTASNGVQTFNKLAGGIRINSIIDYDANGTKLLEKYFNYEDPFVIMKLDDFTNELDNPFIATNREMVGNRTDGYCIYIRANRNASTKWALGTISGGTIGYGKVTLQKDLTGNGGKTVSIFQHYGNMNEEASKVFPYPPVDPRDDRRGLLLEQIDYNDKGIMVQQTKNTYDYVKKGSITGVKVGSGVIYNCTECCFDPLLYCGYKYNIYRLTTEQVNKIQSTTTEYDNVGQKMVEKVSYQYYDNSNYTQPTKTITFDSKTNLIPITINGKQVYNREIHTSYLYPYDYSGDATLQAMTANNMISSPVEVTKQLAVVSNGSQVFSPLHWSKTTYQFINNKFYVPVKIESKLGAATQSVTELELINYDANGNLTQYKERNGLTTWLTYYSDAGKINLLKEKKIGGGTSGTDLLQTTTYDYYPLIGIKSVTEPNGIVNNYKYDDLGRLTDVKKASYAIKKYQYNYKQ